MNFIIIMIHGSYSYYIRDKGYENYGEIALSKIDEENLKRIARDLKLDYIHMTKTSDIDLKLKRIKQEISKAQTEEKKIDAYQDTYYYFAIPLAGLLIIDFIMKKRRM